VYQLSAQYGGDANFAGSYTPIVATLTIPKATSTVSFTSPGAYVLTGTQTSLNYIANGVQVNTYVVQDPTGTVTFTDSVNGGAAQSLGSYGLLGENGLSGGYSLRTTLPAGTNMLTATYSGNANFNPTSSSLTVIVGSPDFTLTSEQTSLKVPAGSSASSTLTLTPELGYTGTVSLDCGSGVPAGSSCTVSPSSLALGAGQTAVLTIATSAPSPATQAASTRGIGMMGSISLAGLILLLVPRTRRRSIQSIQSMLWMVLLAAILPLGCGGSGSPKDTLLAIASSNTKAASGSSITLTATLSSLTGDPTGTVTFYDGTAAIGSPVTVSQNTASLQTSLAVGAHTINAVYGGDSHNAKSTSIAITQVITGSTTITVNATSGILTHTISLPVSIQ
jgi:large repetitive protein